MRAESTRGPGSSRLACRPFRPRTQTPGRDLLRCGRVASQRAKIQRVMREPSRWLGGAAGLLAGSIASPAEPVSIWYRSAEGCPTGDAFLARLAAHDVVGRVAQVGDRIDFVVTLGQN